MPRLLIAVLAAMVLSSGCGSSSQPLTGVTDPDVAPDTDSGSDTDADNADNGDNGDNGDDTDADALGLFDSAVIEGMIETGLSRTSAECILAELRAMDVNILRLASEITATSAPDELWDAAEACGDELTADGTFALDFGLPAGIEIDSYGDDPTLDALWDGCEAGDLAACDELYWSTPVGSGYEAFGSTCGQRGAETYGECAGGDAPDVYGDDADLDILWDLCELGDGTSCDELYWTSAIGSAYEAFGASCGDRSDASAAGTCEDGIGMGPGPAGGSYGDDPALDALWDACDAGDGDACDRLYFESPIGSAYEAFGATCGNRYPEGRLECADAMRA